jgi:hypothetical protein
MLQSPGTIVEADLMAIDEDLRTAEDDVEGHRLATNDNETVEADDPPADDVEGHRLASNDNEVVVADEDDVEGHRLSSNDNEVVVTDEDDVVEA